MKKAYTPKELLNRNYTLLPAIQRFGPLVKLLSGPGEDLLALIGPLPQPKEDPVLSFKADAFDRLDRQAKKLGIDDGIDGIFPRLRELGAKKPDQAIQEGQPPVPVETETPAQVEAVQTALERLYQEATDLGVEGLDLTQPSQLVEKVLAAFKRAQIKEQAMRKARQRDLEGNRQLLGVNRGLQEESAKHEKAIEELRAELERMSQTQKEAQEKAEKAETELGKRPTRAEVEAAREEGLTKGRQEAQEATTALGTERAAHEQTQAELEKARTRITGLSQRAEITPDELASLRQRSTNLEQKLTTLKDRPGVETVRKLPDEEIEALVERIFSDALNEEDIEWMAYHQSKVFGALEMFIPIFEAGTDAEAQNIIEGREWEDKLVEIFKGEELERFTGIFVRMTKTSQEIRPGLPEPIALEVETHRLNNRRMGRRLLEKVKTAIEERRGIEEEPTTEEEEQMRALVETLKLNEAVSAELLEATNRDFQKVAMRLKRVDLGKLAADISTPDLKEALGKQGKEWIGTATASGLEDKQKVRIFLATLQRYLLAQFPDSEENRPSRNLITDMFNVTGVPREERVNYLKAILEYIL